VVAAPVQRQALSFEPDAADGRSAAAGRKLLDCVLGRRGRAERARREEALRRGAAATGAFPQPEDDGLGAARGLVDKIARHAYRVTEEDIAEARAGGWSEDELFDVTVATALGAGFSRRAIGRDAVARWEARQ
jgi:hypothetical protein